MYKGHLTKKYKERDLGIYKWSNICLLATDEARVITSAWLIVQSFNRRYCKDYNKLAWFRSNIKGSWQERPGIVYGLTVTNIYIYIRGGNLQALHDPIPKRFLIYIFSPINSLLVSMLFVNSWNLCVSVLHLKSRGANLGFTIQFNYDYHYQLNITMRHILSFQYYCTWLHFHINFISNLFCAKLTFFIYISRLLFKTITYLK